MYQGRYHRPVKKRRARKKSNILIVSLVLMIGIVVGGTAAYLQDMTNTVENTFTPAKVEITMTETKTDTTKSEIEFQNTGDVPVYIRATLVVYWTDVIDGEEQVIAKPDGASVSEPVAQSDDWFKVGDIYYYRYKVEPGTETSVMTDEIKVTIPDGSSAECHIDVRAEAIQAIPTDAVENAWADIDVDTGGKLTAASAAG